MKSTTTTTTATTTTIASTVNQQQTTTTNTMEQDLFQFFDSLSHPSPVGDWFTSAQDTASSQVAPATTTSTHSSPEIATPLDSHLSPSQAKADQLPSCAFGTAIGVGAGDIGTAADLDMSEILNSPIFDSPVTAMTPGMTPATPHIDMFSDLNQQDLPSALAAFVAAVSGGPTPTVPATGAAFVASTSSAVVQPLPSSTPAATTTPPPTTFTSLASPSMSRKRSSPVEETSPLDEAALKRQKNTDAARRSRLKKVMKMEAFEKRVNDLERMNAQLLLRVAVLDSEKSHLQTKEASHEARIKTLEAQLAEAHKALASRSS